MKVNEAKPKDSRGSIPVSLYFTVFTWMTRMTRMTNWVLCPFCQVTGLLRLLIRDHPQAAAPGDPRTVDGEPNPTTAGGRQTIAFGGLLQGAFGVQDH